MDLNPFLVLAIDRITPAYLKSATNLQQIELVEVELYFGRIS